MSVCFDVLRHISYRFRLVSISCDPSFTFSIDSHLMTIIEVEGTNVKPLVVDSLQIFAGTRGSYILSCVVLTVSEIGQRYSVVVRRSISSSYRTVGLTVLIFQVNATQPVNNYCVYQSS